LADRVRSPLTWVGGKYYSAARILNAFPSPESYTTYVEPFGGAGHVLFRKPLYQHIEVYNDANGSLVNFWMQCRNQPKELQALVDSLPYSRQLHDEWHKQLFVDNGLTDLEKAVQWFYVLRSSFGSMLGKTKSGWAYVINRSGTNSRNSMANRIHSIADTFSVVAERLKNVQVEHRNFDKVIATYESHNTLFYCDPPYVEKERYYEFKDVPLFTEQDHRQLAKMLNNTPAKVALSYYPHPLIDALYPATKWRRISWHTWKTVPKANPTRPKATELLLMNYQPNTLQKGEAYAI
jgi:DNA adenine methylase